MQLRYLIISSLVVYGIQAQPAQIQDNPTQRVTRTTAYSLLFREWVGYHALADRLASHGKSQGTLRSSHETILELNVNQSAQVYNVALNCNSRLGQLDKEAQLIIAAGRRHVELYKFLPPPPPRLAELQMQRNAAVEKAIAEIEIILGSGAFVYFDSLVQRYVGSQLRTIGGGQ